VRGVPHHDSHRRDFRFCVGLSDAGINVAGADEARVNFAKLLAPRRPFRWHLTASASPQPSEFVTLLVFTWQNQTGALPARS
jgi:hypothetical protein